MTTDYKLINPTSSAEQNLIQLLNVPKYIKTDQYKPLTRKDICEPSGKNNTERLL